MTIWMRSRGKRLCQLVTVVLVICSIGRLLIDFCFTKDYITQRTETEVSPSNFPVFQLYFNASGHQFSDTQDHIVPPKHSSANGAALGNVSCQVPRFDPTTKHPSYVSCRRKQPVGESCHLADKLLFSEPKPTCKDKETTDICKIEESKNGYDVSCSNDVCKSATGIELGLFSSKDWMVKYQSIKNTTTLEHTIRDLLQKNSSNGNYGFCFLTCKRDDSRATKYARQLLLLPQNFSQHTCNEKPCRDSVNINVIWLDSTSHSHFYRSLPKSAETLRSIQKKNIARVFSYNLMQALNGGTIENTEVFTGGSRKVGFGNLLKLYQTGGHYVTYVNDLCWKNGVNIPGMAATLKDLSGDAREAVRKASELLMANGIDQVGMSLANCVILSMNQVRNALLEISGNNGICFNGILRYDYLLDWMELLQIQLKAARRPFFNYLDLAIAHEPTARRIQTFDERLSAHMEFLSKQDNTLTLMFGDHGLRYGQLYSSSKEGEVELSHPVCFVIASNDLEGKLGKYKMDILRVNQDRMVDIIDLRQTLLTLSPVEDDGSLRTGEKYDSHPNGLFHPINPKRSCWDMGIGVIFGKCICDEGHVSHKISNDTKATVLADFALGEINNMIQEQFVFANKESTSGFGSCQRLVGTWIDKVEETWMNNYTVTEMEVHFPAGSNAPQTEDRLFVVVKVDSNPTPQDGPSIQLIHYERVSTYGVYDECRDEGVNPRLCVCSPASERSSAAEQFHLQPTTVFGVQTSVVNLGENVFLYERRTSYGIVLEAFCNHPNGAIQLALHTISKVNVVTSKPLPVVTSVKCSRIYFLAAVYQLIDSQIWSLEYNVQFRQIL